MKAQQQFAENSEGGNNHTDKRRRMEVLKSHKIKGSK